MYRTTGCGSISGTVTAFARPQSDSAILLCIVLGLSHRRSNVFNDLALLFSHSLPTPYLLGYVQFRFRLPSVLNGLKPCPLCSALNHYTESSG